MLYTSGVERKNVEHSDFAAQKVLKCCCPSRNKGMISRFMICRYLIFFAIVTGGRSFLQTGGAPKAFRKFSIFRASDQFQEFELLTKLAFPEKTQWMKNFNFWHTKELSRELILSGETWPSSLEAQTRLAASKMKGWTMPCFELDANNMTMPVSTVEPRVVWLKRTWDLEPGYETSTIFLGCDYRFGRPDKGDRPILFETIAFAADDSVSIPFRCSTYEEAMLQHVKVCELVADKKMTYVAKWDDASILQ